MKICDKCFTDAEIRQSINMLGSVGVCDCCGQSSYVIDITNPIFYDYVLEFLKLFECATNIDSNSLTILELIKQDWNIFSSDNNAFSILQYILKNNQLGYSINDKVSYINEVQECAMIWEQLKNEVKNHKRYFANVDALIASGYIDKKHAITIKKDIKLYRARVIPEDKISLNTKEMGCPPPNKATAGRANPIGIPYLYLCEKEETTFYEIKSLYLDKVSIGEFKLQRDLQILDFSSKLNLFQSFTDSGTNCDMTDLTREKLLYSRISEDLSKPRSRYDSEVEYVPTQLICEYCKINGIDGIKFKSSLDPNGGTNIVLFDPDSAECTNTYIRDVSSVMISYS